MDSIQKIHNDLFEHLRTKYPELRFKLREDNKYDRLDRGYWFLGNDQYLGTSFWEGTDWQNKTPNIMLGVDLVNLHNPQVYLEFVANDDEAKATFFSNVATPLGMVRAKKEGKDLNKWMKSYMVSSYLEGVNQFVERDKPILDSFIKSYGIVDLFPEIDPKKFNENLLGIEELRQQELESAVACLELPLEEIDPLVESEPLRIKRLFLQNISQFRMFDAHLDSNLTCFIGENGCGKTSILRAILLGLIGVDQNAYLSDNADLADSLANLLMVIGENNGEIKYAKSGKIALYTNEQSEPTGVNFLFNQQSAPKLQDEGAFEAYISENGNLDTLVMGFSQIQNVQNGKVKTLNLSSPNITDIMPLLANIPDTRGNSLHQWIMALDHDASSKEKNKENSVERLVINRMFQIISDITNQVIHFHSVNAQKEIIWIIVDGKILPLKLLSQGFNNVFSWIGYFMKRLSETAPEGTEDPTQLPAICLIDEIDTYLHPLWQQTIVPALLKHFPNTQFIITTHSPIVVSNMKQGKLYKLENGEVIEIPTGYFGKDYSLTLEAIMNAPSRNKGVQKELDELFDLIDQEKFYAARLELLNLQEKYPNEPELSRAETMLTLLAD